MADVFNSRTGFVAVIPGQAVIPGRVKLSGFDPQAALIAGVDYNQRTNQQFQYALDSSVFIYVFGDEMGNVLVSGMAFPQLCDGSSNGLSEVLKFYAENRASKKSELIEVSIGDELISGFLTQLTVKAVGAAWDPIALIQSYTLTINTLPKR